MRRTILLFGPVMLMHPGLGRAGVGECYDSEGACTDPCPCENACYGHEDCPEGLVCLPGCLAPVICSCDDGYWWSSSDLCAGECYEWPEPTGPPTHTIIDLGTLGGEVSSPTALNDLGQVIGKSERPPPEGIACSTTFFGRTAS